MGFETMGGVALKGNEKQGNLWAVRNSSNPSLSAGIAIFADAIAYRLKQRFRPVSPVPAMAAAAMPLLWQQVMPAVQGSA